MKEINEKDLEMAAGGLESSDIDGDTVHDLEDTCEQFEELPNNPFAKFHHECSHCVHGKFTEQSIEKRRVFCILGVKRTKPFNGGIL